MNTDAILDDIHADTYWRIVIRPTVFEPQRLLTVSQCKKVIEQATVQLRGGLYPYWRETSFTGGNGWIQSALASGSRRELWRLYQSGQFVHHKAAIERFQPPPWQPPPPERPIFVEGIVYLVTAVYEFAARMAAQKLLFPNAHIEIELHNSLGRRLVFWDAFLSPLGGDHECQVEPLQVVKEMDPATLAGIAGDLALEAIAAVFERFGWFDPPRDLLINLRDRELAASGYGYD